ncbi:MAG: TIGR02594 family protein [Bradyrhizobium sp.]
MPAAAACYSVATHFKGLNEIHGSLNNPQIIELFRLSGHPEVKDDETPWCAAFVGGCLRLSGYRSSGSLLARSYQEFGQHLDSPERGCIVVFERGDPSAGTGHVAFFDHQEGDRIFVLGGNQRDAVNIAPFSRASVLAFRMPVEAAPLPTDTTLPNILTLDPANAPPHLLSGAIAPPVTAGPREARASEALANGATGPQVVALQQALVDAGLQPGAIDGEFGPLTATAVSNFQSMKGLPVTGVADANTLRNLGLAVPVAVQPSMPAIAGEIPIGGSGMQQQDILKIALEILAAQNKPPVVTPATPAATGIDTSQLLKIVLGALTGQVDATTAGTPPVMSPIDKVLGGEALQGKKTPLAILAYAVLAILQSVDVAGTATGATATPTGQILTTLIGAFGGLGVLSKVDRVVQMMGIIAAKPK